MTTGPPTTPVGQLVPPFTPILPPPSVEGEALRIGVILSPADDAPKLVYADWCDERGCDELAAGLRWAAANKKWPYMMEWHCGESPLAAPTHTGYAFTRTDNPSNFENYTPTHRLPLPLHAALVRLGKEWSMNNGMELYDFLSANPNLVFNDTGLSVYWWVYCSSPWGLLAGIGHVLTTGK